MAGFRRCRLLRSCRSVQHRLHDGTTHVDNRWNEIIDGKTRASTASTTIWAQFYARGKANEVGHHPVATEVPRGRPR